MDKLKPLAPFALLAGLTLSACANAPLGSGPMLADPSVMARSHVDVVRMTSDWVNANEEFGDTFTEALHENLRACARGPNRLDLNVRVTEVQRANRFVSLLRGGGEHRLAAVAELVEPGTKTVVGRYPIHVIVDAGGPVAIALADRQLMVSDAFATQLCREAFGA